MELMALDDRKKIVEEVEYNDKVVCKIKYGILKIMGEDFEREITWDTYKYLKKLPANFKGIVEIKELNLTIPVHQIVKLEEKEKESIKYKSFTNLPTETLMLDKNFNILKDTRLKVEKENDRYYLATCHFMIDNDEKQYYMKSDEIKYLVEMIRDKKNLDYPHYVGKSLRYGMCVGD